MRRDPHFLSCGTFDLAKFQDEEREEGGTSGASLELPFKEGGGLIHDMTSGLSCPSVRRLRSGLVPASVPASGPLWKIGEERQSGTEWI